MELNLEWGGPVRPRLLHWVPDTGGLVRLYRAAEENDPPERIVHEKWVQECALSAADIRQCRAFFDAVDALR